MATVGTVASELATEFGEQYSDLDVKDQYIRWIQEVYEEIVASGRWFFNNSERDYTLTSASRLLTLDARTSEVRDVILVSQTLGEATTAVNVKLPFSPVERLSARGLNLLEKGRPKAWYYYGVNAGDNAIILAFYPMPDIDTSYALTIVGLDHATSFADTDLLPLPTEYVSVLRDGVRAKVRANDGSMQDAMASRQTFEQRLGLLNARYGALPTTPSRLAVKRMRGQTLPINTDGA